MGVLRPLRFAASLPELWASALSSRPHLPIFAISEIYGEIISVLMHIAAHQTYRFPPLFRFATLSQPKVSRLSSSAFLMSKLALRIVALLITSLNGFIFSPPSAGHNKSAGRNTLRFSQLFNLFFCFSFLNPLLQTSYKFRDCDFAAQIIEDIFFWKFLPSSLNDII